MSFSYPRPFHLGTRLIGMVLTAALLCMTPGLLVGEVWSSPPQEFGCVMEPQVVVNVGSGVDGLLDQILVDRGDRVREGQVIAQLESSLQHVAVRIARIRSNNESIIATNKARVEFGKRRLIRTQQLYQDEISSLSELDEAETSKLLADLSLEEAKEERLVSELELDRAQTDLKLRTIHSPITGIVIERFLSPGELVSRTPILKLAQVDPLRVEVFLPVRLLGKVRVGQTVQVRLNDFTHEKHQAEVTVVDKVADAASGMFGVRLTLSNPNYRMPAGLKCTVQFPIQ